MNRVALVCPYCGSSLHVSTRIEERPYMERDVPDEIECTNWACRASWTPGGVPISAAQWIEWPDLYRNPQAGG